MKRRPDGLCQTCKLAESFACPIYTDMDIPSEVLRCPDYKDQDYEDNLNNITQRVIVDEPSNID